MGYQGGRRYGGDDYGYGRDQYQDRFRAERDYRGDHRNMDRGQDYRAGEPRGQRYGRDDHRDWDRSRERERDHNDYDDRGFFDRAADEVRSWFGDEEAERRRDYDERMNRRYGDPREQSNRLGFAPSGGRGGYQPFWDQHSAQARDYSGRTGYGQHWGDDFDHNYRAWRDQRMAELDHDYHEYQQENRQRFNSEFGTWRDRRTQQRGSLGQVREHMEVVGSDGTHVGTVDRCSGDRIILAKTDKDAGGMHHSIPSRWIDKVEGERVTLEKTADEAHHAWRLESEQQAMFGDRQQSDLNRQDRWREEQQRQGQHEATQFGGKGQDGQRRY